MGLVRFILFVLFFYLIYFLVRYIFIKPFREGYANGGNRKQKHNPFGQKEGDVSITYKPERHHENKKVGEYIDYEEVKE